MRTLIFTSLFLGLSACVSTPPELWAIETKPPGATVTTSLGQSCHRTPCSISISTGEDFVATIEKPGYQTIQVDVRRRVSGGQIAGQVGWFLVGVLAQIPPDPLGEVDAGIHPNPLRIELVPIVSEIDKAETDEQDLFTSHPPH